MALPTLADSGSNSATASGTISVSPAGGAASEGQYIEVWVHGTTGAQVIEPSDGVDWDHTRRWLYNDNTNGSTMSVFRRIAGASEPSSYSFRRTGGANDNWAIVIHVWDGVNVANPCLGQTGTALGTGTNRTTPATTSELNDSIVVTGIGINGNATVVTPPAGYTLIAEVDGADPGLSVYYKTQASAGTTGSAAWEISASQLVKGLTHTIRPATAWSYVQSIVTAGTNVDNGGGNAWSNPGNITAEDGSVASATVNGTAATDFLDGQMSTPFAIPAGATRKGYEVLLVQRERGGGTTGNCRDNSLRLLDGGGSAVGDNKALTASWPTDPQSLLYGGPDDLWGTSLAVDDVNDAQFGARFALQGAAAGADRIGEIECFEITAYYEPAAGVAPRALHHQRHHNKAA